MAKKGLFLDDYLFRGEHETKARTLTNLIDNASGSKIFNSAVQLYMMSAIVGCTLGRKAKPQKGDKTLRIMVNQFNNHYGDLMFIYKLVMLVAEKNTVKSIDRINRAFRYQEEECNIKIFEEYMLGGLEELYENFINQKNRRYDDYLNSLTSFINIFNNKGKVDIDIDETELFEGDIF